MLKTLYVISTEREDVLDDQWYEDMLLALSVADDLRQESGRAFRVRGIDMQSVGGFRDVE